MLYIRYDFKFKEKMTLTEKLAGHQAARKVGDMRVTGLFPISLDSILTWYFERNYR